MMIQSPQNLVTGHKTPVVCRKSRRMTSGIDRQVNVSRLHLLSLL